MNQPWKPPQQCTCGCKPCQCQECPPLFADERLIDCWRQISAFKRMIEGIIAELGPTSGEQGPAGPQGPQGQAGPEGPQGPAGSNGANGAPGPAGMVISYVGPTAPANPQNGDMWLNTTDNSLHIYQAGTGWLDISGGGVPVPGPAGPAGAAGPMGPQGPQGIQGSQGQAGPQGAAGAPGSAGSQGPQGIAGPQGPAGTASLTIGAVGTYGLSLPMNSVGHAVGDVLAGANYVMPAGARTGNWQVCSWMKDAGNMYVYLLQRIS